MILRDCRDCESESVCPDYIIRLEEDNTEYICVDCIIDGYIPESMKDFSSPPDFNVDLALFSLFATYFNEGERYSPSELEDIEMMIEQLADEDFLDEIKGGAFYAVRNPFPHAYMVNYPQKGFLSIGASFVVECPGCDGKHEEGVSSLTVYQISDCVLEDSTFIIIPSTDIRDMFEVDL